MHSVDSSFSSSRSSSKSDNSTEYPTCLNSLLLSNKCSNIFKFQEFYQNEAFDELNIDICADRDTIYCDVCMTKNPVLLEKYYQYANAVRYKIYDKIAVNVKALFFSKLDHEKALVALKMADQNIKRLMQIARNFRDQTFRIYRFILSTKNSVAAEFSQNVMNEFTTLMSCATKIHNLYEFITDIIQRNIAPLDMLQILTRRQVLNFTKSVDNTDNCFMEFEVFIDVFFETVRGSLEILEKNAKMFVTEMP